MSLRIAAIVAGFLPLAFAPVALAAEDCPAVKVEKEPGRIAVYPGGVPGLNRLDFEFIAVVISAQAVCHEDDDDNIVADVTITYALEPGSLYRGSAVVELFASVTTPGNPEGRQATVVDTINPPTGTKVTSTAVVKGLLLGSDDTVDEGGLTVTAGFVKKAATP